MLLFVALLIIILLCLELSSTEKRSNKMKTIFDGNDNVTLDEFKSKWQWTTDQFLNLNTFRGDFYAKWKKLDSIVQEMIEERFNSLYEAQNK
jgi:hypothetical protein